MPKDTNAGTHAGPKRRIMRTFKIAEISGVDKPAQSGAVAVIMKRNDSQTAEELEKRSALTTVERGHVHLMVLNGPPDGVDLNAGQTSYDDGHQHPWVRTEGGPIVIGLAKDIDGNPHTHMVAVISKNDGTEDGTADPAGGTGTVGTEGTTMPDPTKKNEGPTVEELQAQLAHATSVAALNDAEKAHLETLKGDEQTAFLAKSADERKAVIEDLAKNAQDEDPVVYTTSDGIPLRKSVGEAFVAIAKSNDALRKDNAELKKQREQDAFEKRADEELAHLPGTTVERAAMLKAIEGIEDDGQRKAALGALKAQNEALSSAFKDVGSSIAPAAGSPDESLDTLAKKHHEDNPALTYEQSYDAVLKTATGAALYAKSVN